MSINIENNIDSAVESYIEELGNNKNIKLLNITKAFITEKIQKFIDILDNIDDEYSIEDLETWISEIFEGIYDAEIFNHNNFEVDDVPSYISILVQFIIKLFLTIDCFENTPDNYITPWDIIKYLPEPLKEIYDINSIDVIISYDDDEFVHEDVSEEYVFGLLAYKYATERTYSLKISDEIIDESLFENGIRYTDFNNVYKTIINKTTYTCNTIDFYNGIDAAISWYGFKNEYQFIRIKDNKVMTID